VKLISSKSVKPRPKYGDLSIFQYGSRSHLGFSKFSAHACCGQTPGWIKMPLGMEGGLGPGRIVLDHPTHGKGTTAPTFEIYGEGFAYVRIISGPFVYCG